MTPFDVAILKLGVDVTIVAVVAGVAPVAGAVTVNATAVSAVSVYGNWYEIVRVLPVLLSIVALYPLIVRPEPADIPVKVFVPVAVNTTVAVYLVYEVNVVPMLGAHVTVPAVKFGVGVFIVTPVVRVVPVTGVCTVIAAAGIVVYVAVN